MRRQLPALGNPTLAVVLLFRVVPFGASARITWLHVAFAPTPCAKRADAIAIIARRAVAGHWGVEAG